MVSGGLLSVAVDGIVGAVAGLLSGGATVDTMVPFLEKYRHANTAPAPINSQWIGFMIRKLNVLHVIFIPVGKHML